MITPQLILHLSDLHFGQYSRFAAYDPSRLGKDTGIDVLAEVHRLTTQGKLSQEAKVNLIVVTGDIAETAKPAEYELALKFFRELLQELQLKPDRLVVTPGNHDISWAECRKVEIDSDTYDWKEHQLLDAMNRVKFKHFNIFLENLYGDSLGAISRTRELGDGGRLYDFSELELSVAAINSCEKESHRAGDHLGCLRSRQAQALWNMWNNPRLSSQVRIITLHHNPVPTVPDEIDRLSDELHELLRTGKLTQDLLTRYLTDAVGLQGSDMLHHVAAESQVQIVLHGHHHAEAHPGSWPWTGSKIGMCHILSAGAWGAAGTPKARPVVMRLLGIDPTLSPEEGGICSLLLRYEPYEWAPGRVRTGRWTLSGSERNLPLWLNIDTESESRQRPLLKPSVQHKPETTTGEAEYIRVSMAALVRFENDGQYLLVRNFHRPEQFGPFGGCFKYSAGATTRLKEIGFIPETSYRSQEPNHKRDLQYDLRGYVAPQNLKHFIKWFDSQTARESSDACLHRELREELKDAKVSQDMINRVGEYTFKFIREAPEGPKPTLWGYDQFRYTVIYEPDYDDPEHGAMNRQITRDLFDLADSHHPDLLVVDRPALARLRANKGELLTTNIDYFFSATKRDYEPAPFGQIECASVAERRMNEFLKSKESVMIMNTKVIGKPILLHAVQKYYSESVVARVTLDGAPHILKYYPDAGGIYVRKEKWAIEILSRHGVPVPRLLEAAEDAPAFTILEYLAGQRLSDLAVTEIRGYMPEIMPLISKLHKIRCDHYGEIIGEFAPVGNHRELAHYIKCSVDYWRKEIDKNLRPEHYSFDGISELLAWGDLILARTQHAQFMPVSTLSTEPRLCHSDIKLTDIIVDSTFGRPKFSLIDFDNVFAFVPEFDLCKLHFNMSEHGIQMGMDEYAQLVADHYGMDIRLILKGLVNFYPFVLTRLLNWATKRNHEPLIVTIGKAMQRLARAD